MLFVVVKWELVVVYWRLFLEIDRHIHRFSLLQSVFASHGSFVVWSVEEVHIAEQEVHTAEQEVRIDVQVLHVSELLVWADSRQRQRSSRRDTLQNKSVS
jgi:hypothetical protein